jgi:predicted XRE-type DNA-binding protein
MGRKPNRTIEKGRTRRKKHGSGAFGSQGSGNVFADLGLPNPEQELLKAQLTSQIHTILKDSGIRQAEIAKVLGVQQPQVSLLMRNRLVTAPWGGSWNS